MEIAPALSGAPKSETRTSEKRRVSDGASVNVVVRSPHPASEQWRTAAIGSGSVVEPFRAQRSVWKNVPFRPCFDALAATLWVSGGERVISAAEPGST